MSVNKVFAAEGYRLIFRFSITYVASGNNIKMYVYANYIIMLFILLLMFIINSFEK